MMHPLTRSTIAQAQRRGYAITIEAHLPAILALEAAARATDHGSIQETIDWLDRPITLGHARPVQLRPLSLAGKMWIEEVEQQGWFAGDPLLETLAIAWACANSRDLAAMRNVGGTERRARRTIRNWAAAIDCPIRALTAAVRHIMLPPSEADAVAPQTVRDAQREAGSGCIGEILARLVHEFGRDFEYWLSAPWSEVDAAMQLLRKDSEDMEKATGKSAAPDPQSPSVRAFARWRKARQQFLAALQEPPTQ
jgi:glutathione S-transferase